MVYAIVLFVAIIASFVAGAIYGRKVAAKVISEADALKKAAERI